MEYRNNYSFSIIGFILTSISYIFVLILLVFILKGFTIPKLDNLALITFSLVYLIALYIYLGKTNFDFTLSHDSLKITNRLPLFKHSELILLSDIRKVIFKHDWNETYNQRSNRNYFVKQLKNLFKNFIPHDLKWVKVITNKTRKYNCFGIEFEGWEKDGLVIDDLFLELSERGIPVEWTNDIDVYYKHMNEQARLKYTKPIESKVETDTK